MNEPNPKTEDKKKIFFNKKRNVGIEMFEVDLNRSVKKQFFKKGKTTKSSDNNGTYGHCILGKTILAQCKATMKIGDTFEGKRVLDIKFDTLHITNIEEKPSKVGFIYTLD